MRVTPSITYRNFLSAAENLNSQLSDVNDQVTTGKRLVHLDDSPTSSSELVGLKADVSQIDQFRSNGNTGTYFLNMADTALNSLHNLVTTIFTKGSEATSEVATPALKQGSAVEIRNLRDEILALANTETRGRYIFAGSQILTTPFTIAGDTTTYHGDTNVNLVQVGAGLTVRENEPGGAVFSPVFNSISALVTALDANDNAGVKAALGQFESMLNGISQARARVGSDMARLENLQYSLDNDKTNLQERVGKVEDADMAAAISDLTRIQTALRTTLTAKSMMDRNNLFDFLA